MLNQQRTIIKLFLSFLLLCLLTSPVAAQVDEGVRLRITQIDTSNFPEISLNISATDTENNPINVLDGLALQENDQTIDDFETDQISVGMEFIFVIDANTTIEQIDETDGLSRRETIRDSIVSFAENTMDRGGQDDLVSIIVPDDEGGRFLEEPDMTFPNEVINAINFYETGTLGDTPLNAMLELALDQAEENQNDGRYQVIFLFTDGAQLNSQLDYEALVERAQNNSVGFYGAILGARADPNEIENVTQLTDPTGGTYIHMPQSAEADSLFEAINSRAEQTEITYRSTINESGRQQIVVSLADRSAEVFFNLTVEPPVITMILDNSQPIRRVAADAETPLEEMEPTSQPLGAEVSWPDDYPRTLRSATLLVNGEEVALDAPVLDDNGLLTFEWNISGLDEGDYELEVRAVDELGLESFSEPLLLVIEIDRPEAAAGTETPEAVEETEAEPDQAAEGTSIVDTLRENAAIVGIGLGGLLLVTFIAIVAVIVIRRRGGGDSETPAPDFSDLTYPHIPPLGTASGSPATTSEQFDVDATFLMQPDFAIQGVGGAYLEPLEYAPEHTGMIPLVGANVALGRDPNLVQIPFNDRSVSRLHARIMESNGVFRLYDEGSASGTYLNYERIGLTPKVVSDKDDLHFGRVHLRFHIAAPRQDDDPTQVLGSSRFDAEEGTDTQIYLPPG